MAQNQMKGRTITSPTSSKPVHVMHQSQTIPIEFEPPISPFSSAQSDSNHAVGTNPFYGFVHRDIVITSGQDTSNHVSIAKAETKKNDVFNEDQEGKFSEYISKVKRRMRTTMSNIGGGGGGRRNAAKRDSFNDKVMDYINHAKIKIRTTTIVGNQKTDSVK